MKHFVTFLGMVFSAWTFVFAAQPITLDKGNLRSGDDILIPFKYSGRPYQPLQGDDVVSVRLVRFSNLISLGISFDKRTYHYVSFYKPSGEMKPNSPIYLVDVATFRSDSDMVIDGNKVESMLGPNVAIAQQLVGSCNAEGCLIAFRGNKTSVLRGGSSSSDANKTTSIRWKRSQDGKSYQVYIDRWDTFLPANLQPKSPPPPIEAQITQE